MVARSMVTEWSFGRTAPGVEAAAAALPAGGTTAGLAPGVRARDTVPGALTVEMIETTAADLAALTSGIAPTPETGAAALGGILGVLLLAEMITILDLVLVLAPVLAADLLMMRGLAPGHPPGPGPGLIPALGPGMLEWRMRERKDPPLDPGVEIKKSFQQCSGG